MSCSHQIKPITEAPLEQINIISDCNKQCMDAIQKKYGLRNSTLSERFTYLDNGLGVIMPIKIISIDGVEKKYNSIWDGKVNLFLPEGIHRIKLTRSYASQKQVQTTFEGELKKGQYSFGLYKVDFGYSDCWFPYVYEYATDTLLLPKNEELEWFEGFRYLMNIDAMRFDLKGIKYNSEQCNNMKNYLKNSHLTQ